MGFPYYLSLPLLMPACVLPLEGSLPLPWSVQMDLRQLSFLLVSHLAVCKKCHSWQDQSTLQSNFKRPFHHCVKLNDTISATWWSFQSYVLGISCHLDEPHSLLSRETVNHWLPSALKPGKITLKAAFSPHWVRFVCPLPLLPYLHAWKW